jgi:protein arginine kinase activator
MLCQRCGQKEATVHLTKIVNGEKTELFLCEDCAKETGQLPFNEYDPFSFQNLLKGILNPELSSVSGSGMESTCSRCGLDYKEFSQEGLFGCPECYNAFADRLDPLLKRIHGSNHHNGKVPKRRGGTLRVRREIEELRVRLQKEVDRENFEKAAELRDQIHELEAQLGGE